MSAAGLQVVYVAGSSHSGSTLLALLAGQHPGMASVGEASVKPRIRRERRAGAQRCSCGRPLSACPFWQAIFGRVNDAGLAFDQDHWTNDYRFEHPWLDSIFTRETSSAALREARRWSARHLPGYRSRVARIDAVNTAFIAAVLAETRARVFLDTTKLPTRLTHLLDHPQLDVRVAWLTRDARGVAYSAKRRGLPVDRATQVWLHDQEAVRRLITTIPADRRYHVRYEDLCADPTATLTGLWTFAGLRPIEVAGAVRPADHHVLGNSMRITDEVRIRPDDRWRSGLTADEQQRILAMAKRMQTALGYR